MNRNDPQQVEIFGPIGLEKKCKQKHRGIFVRFCSEWDVTNTSITNVTGTQGLAKFGWFLYPPIASMKSATSPTAQRGPLTNNHSPELSTLQRDTIDPTENMHPQTTQAVAGVKLQQQHVM